MQEKKKAFNFYRNWHDLMPMMNDTQLGKLTRAISSVMFFEIHIDSISFKDPTLSLAWASIKYQMRSSVDGYANKNNTLYDALVPPCQPPTQPPCQQEEGEEEGKGEGQYVSDSFDEFWSLYPKGHKSSKKGAKAKWVKLPTKHDIILSDVKKRIAEDDRWKAGYVPDVMTYFNKERWDGDIYKDKTVAKVDKVKRSGFEDQAYTEDF